MSNKECYKDPTAEIAIAKVMQEQKSKEMLCSQRKKKEGGKHETEKSNKN